MYFVYPIGSNRRLWLIVDREEHRSFIGRDEATTAKVSFISFESLGICSNRQAVKLPSRILTRLTYLILCWSLASYFPFTRLTTN